MKSVQEGQQEIVGVTLEYLGEMVTGTECFLKYFLERLIQV